ncbi:arabinosyltransferase domain-containing protein [Blastococcus sp. SYSU DS0552]
MSTTLLQAGPGPAAPAPSGRRGRLRGVAALLVGLLGMGLAVAVPFAPVVADRTEVSWPSAGEQPTSTTAMFVPYRPAELQAKVPCAAVRTALDTDDRTTLLATSLVRDDGPASGLVVDTESGRLRVAVNGRVVHSTTPDGADCDVRVASDDAGTTVTVGDGPPTVLGSEPVPEVSAFTTDLSPEDAEGTTVTARTRTWFESVPSALKLGMIGAQIALGLLSLVLLSRWLVRPSGTERTRPATPLRGRLLVLGCDAAVVLALTLWAVIAPQTADDGYALMTIRNGLVSGDIGNYYHWFNAAEAPFTLVQHVVQPLAAVSAAPLWLRLPSYLIGILAWFVVSRGVLPVVVPRSSLRRLASVLAAVFFLAWWLPFNLGLRPEPFVALGVVTVLALLLRGTAPTARRPLLLIGAAALVVGICASVTPSGVLALAPVLALFPRIWRVLRPADPAVRPSWWTTVGVVALLGGLASTGLVVMFADQSWHGVAKATELHTQIGPNLEWYQEMERYSFLMGVGIQGTATKRLAVLLTIGMLLVVVALLVRRLPALRAFPSAHLLTGTMALGFVLLFVTPSKWSHHFGSLAGVGAVFLTLGSLVVVQLVRVRARDRVTVATALAGAGVLALAAALAFSGANAWLLYDEYGLPFSDRPVGPLGNPVVWLLVAAGGAGLLWLGARKAGTGGVPVLVAAPALVCVTAAGASVVLLLAGFSLAPLRQAEAGSYSLAGTNLEALTGGGCGIPEAVEVLIDDPDGPLEPVRDDGGPEDEPAGGFVPGAGYLSPPPGGAGSGPATYTWGSLDRGERTTGELVSPWFGLPELADGQDVAVSAAGRTGGGNLVELEFGRSGDGSSNTPLGTQVIGQGGDQPTWRPLSVAAADVPAGADRVRVRAVDATTDIGGWLAVTGPRVRAAESLQAFLDGRGPVLPDWPLAWHVPCVGNFPVVADGLAQTPTVVIAAPGGYADLASIAYLPEQGGSFAGVSMAQAREVPSRLVGAPQREWGHVLELDYPLGRDLYDRATEQISLWGWEGDR